MGKTTEVGKITLGKLKIMPALNHGANDLRDGFNFIKVFPDFRICFSNMVFGIAIRRNTKTEGGQIPCWKRSSEKMNTWTSARIAAACFRKMPGDAGKSSAQINAARHGIIGTLR